MRGEAVSVIIPTKNAERYIDEQFRAIFSQEGVGRPEVIIVDSGSGDATRRIAAAHSVRVISIKPEEFGHGSTRNLGARESKGDYLVFLTQDATPADSSWLRNLLMPLREDGTVAGAFSRHIPRAGCSLPLARQIEEEWPQTGGTERIVKRVMTREDIESHRPFYVYFANTSSCLRRSVWERMQFREVEFGEDADWAERALLAGYAIVYEPTSAVYHSHDYSAREQLRQHFDYGRFVRSSNLAPVITVRQSVATLLRCLKRDIDYIRRKGYPLGKILASIPYYTACIFGRWLGEHSERMPHGMMKRLSRQKSIKIN